MRPGIARAAGRPADLPEGVKMNDGTELARRYVELWNETDAAARRRMIMTLWAEAGMECAGGRVTRGHAALEARVTTSHERNVREGGNRFLLRGRPARNHDAVKLDWTMSHVADGAVRATGSYVLLLDGSDRIVAAYFFADS
jgi:hypothetical protein